MKEPKGGQAAISMIRRLQTAYDDILISEADQKVSRGAIIAATSLHAVGLVKIVASVLVATQGPDDARKAWPLLQQQMVEEVERAISEHEANTKADYTPPL